MRATPTETVPPRLRAWRSLPGDLARWAFWVKLRELLDPERPEQVARLQGAWRLQYAAARRQKALMRDELRRCFGAADEETVRRAYRIAFRVHTEELLLGKVDARTVRHFMVMEGTEHVDAALARGRGAILLLPHAGNVMMMIAAVSLGGYRYTQYAARGLAPDAVAAAHPEVFGHNRWRAAVREAREAAEDRLPASFITLRTTVRHLFRCLERNELVGIAYDGRIGNRFVRVPYLGREALLNPGAFRMAARTGAAIVPTFNACPDDGPNVCSFGEPLWGDDPAELMRRFLAEAAEPWLRDHPAEYGIWLAHARARAAVDDHPMFTDYAPDDRWRKWPALGG